MKRLYLTPFLLLFYFILSAQGKYDLLITNGKIVDGTGNPWYIGDIGIRKGKITGIGDLSGSKAKRVIDAKGQVVAPCFIDVHAHVEGSIISNSTADNFLYDGVTTLVTGNCGNSELNLKDFFNNIEKTGTSLNVASLFGHNTVRSNVMGTENRAPSAQELKKMQALVEQAMKDGAVGFSTGLIYVPGTFAGTYEIVELAKIAAQYNGVYASHIRNEDSHVLDAIEEAVTVGREAKLPVEISHFKISGKNEWGKSVGMIDKVLEYRREGIDVTVDQYPYTASSTTLAILLPTWALAGDSLKIRLENPETKAKIVKEMKEMLAETGFGTYEYAVVANCSFKPEYNGLSISAINTMRKGSNSASRIDDEIETILELMTPGPRVQMIYHKMGEEDVQRIMQFPYAMVASDAGIPAFGRGAPHPRAYGTNARVLGHYVREQKIITLEDAVRKMTSLPARRFNFLDRGLLLPGMAADIVIFDPNKIIDKATFDKSHAYAEGMDYVLVNGAPVIENGKHNGTKPGKALKANGKRKLTKVNKPMP
ncbi:MAG: N-acyl-D-amino-acid deacylase family protein [Saprospiraceae bacterium]